MTISNIQIQKMLPHNGEASLWVDILNKYLPKYKIDTKNRIACFIGQCSQESAEFTRLKENLNYSEQGLIKIFPKYFQPTAGKPHASLYARKPQKIANYIYANRMGNGNEASGDGWAFSGKGLIQLTGRANVTAFAKSIGKSVEDTVKYLQTREGALESACWYWSTNNLNEYADVMDIAKMTRRINGSAIDLAERQKEINHCLEILS